MFCPPLNPAAAPPSGPPAAAPAPPAPAAAEPGPAAPPCKGCGRTTGVYRRRGRCGSCYARQPKRGYRAAGPLGRAAALARVDFEVPAPLPAEPTRAIPGSEEKILVLMGRHERREALHHPGDVRQPPPAPRGPATRLERARLGEVPVDVAGLMADGLDLDAYLTRGGGDV